MSSRFRMAPPVAAHLALLAAIEVLCIAKLSRAAPMPLEWDAADGCPTTEVLERRLDALLGPDAPRLTGISSVRGVVLKTALGYRLTLEVAESARRRVRSLEAEDCADLVEASALAIALVAREGGEGGALAEASTSASSGGLSSPTPPLEHDSNAIDSAVTAGAPWRWSASAGVALDFGALPSPAPGVALAVGGGAGGWTIAAYGAYLPTQSVAMNSVQSAGFSLLVGGLRGCRRLLENKARVAGCAGFEAGALDASGAGLDGARQVADPWLAPGAALEARGRLLGDVAFELRAEALAPLLRKQYAVNGTDRVHAPSPLDARLYLGLSLASE